MLVLVVLVVLFTGLVATYLSTRPDPKMAAGKSLSATNQATTEPSSNREDRGGTYLNYSPEILESSSGTKLLFFHASWCAQCRKLEDSIMTTQLPDNVTVIKVDYDRHQDLRQKYGVTLQTTIVKLDDRGNLVEKYVAYNEPTFAAVSRHLLE